MLFGTFLVLILSRWNLMTTVNEVGQTLLKELQNPGGIYKHNGQLKIENFHSK